MMQRKTKLNYSETNLQRQMLIQGRDPYVPGWRRQGRFIAPQRFIETEPQRRNQGPNSTRDILTNQAGRSLRTFVSGMMNGATSRARPWFSLTTVNTVTKSASVDRYFSQCVKILNEYLQISNFYRVLPMSYKDIGIFSNSAFAMLPHERTMFTFLPFAVGTYAIGTDSEGTVNTFTRDFCLTVRQVVEQYGQLKPNGHIDWSNFDPWVQQAYERSNYQMSVTLNNLILPNANPVPDSLYSGDSMKYQSYTTIRGAGNGVGAGALFETGYRYTNRNGSDINKFERRDPEKAEFCSYRGWDYFPVIANRWEVAPESDYGVDGPGHMAIDDIISLQETEKYRMEGVAKLVKPPMIAPASLRRHQATILAGGITYVDESSEGTKFRQAFEVDPKMSELLSSQQDYKNAIRTAFYEDLFLMMNEEKKISHVTAREIEERSAEKLIGIGPALGQLDIDQNSRVILNGMHMLQKRGKLPAAPREIQGQQVRPEYISVLAQAAKASMINSTEKLVSFVTTFATTSGDPSLMKMINGEKLIRQYADYLGTDPELILDEYEYATLKKGILEQQAQQVQQDQYQKASETTKNLSQSQVGGTNLLELMGQQSQQL